MRVACVLAVISLVLAPETPVAQVSFERHFEGLNGTFVLLNGATGEYIRHNPQRARERFAPCSTFKIPHTAILLESGVAPDPSFTLKYDPTLRQPSNWAKDFNLAEAYKASALWYYQQMARRVGMLEERRFIERFRYGNADVSGGIDEAGNPFWVDGSLRVSADEQVEFLRRLHDGQLGLSERTTRLTKEVMVAQETLSWRLSAKTGTCQPQGEDTSNWYVGYVEEAKTVHYFSLQIGVPDYGRAYSQRIPIARAILTELGVLD
jgi:beta-lactamase class D